MTNRSTDLHKSCTDIVLLLLLHISLYSYIVYNMHVKLIFEFILVTKKCDESTAFFVQFFLKLIHIFYFEKIPAQRHKTFSIHIELSPSLAISRKRTTGDPILAPQFFYSIQHLCFIILIEIPASWEIIFHKNLRLRWNKKLFRTHMVLQKNVLSKHEILRR